MQKKYSGKVTTWLFIGLVMIFIQVVVGGITRLTESGLSITKWEVVSGTIPPFTEDAWNNEFELYKNTPQFREINEGMDLDDFKFIYFWEYIHRFWARLMGLVFIVPFFIFLLKRQLDSEILIKLSLVILLAVLAATFGWIMVASGLIERPWVNAYKLSIHLLIAFGVYTSLLWTYLFSKDVKIYTPDSVSLEKIKTILWVVFTILVVQIFFGGVMAGMKAAVLYPTWPDMRGTYLPDILLDLSQWNFQNFNDYDKNYFMPAIIHFLHRNTAYLLFIAGSFLSYRLVNIKDKSNHYLLKKSGLFLFIVLVVQVLLGILTIVLSNGSVPVLWGVLHQAGALILLTVIVFIFFILRTKK